MAKRCYFAYGSNMDVSQMKCRCASATLLQVATLKDHQLLINTRGFATVVPNEGYFVYGVVWSISGEDEAELDRYEGVSSGHYERSEVGVDLSDGTSEQALVYIATDCSPGKPRPGYLEKIIAAGEAHGLPQSYLEELSRCL